MKVPVLIFYIWSWYKLWYYLHVYLPALKGYIPNDMIHALCTFLNFCYLAHCDIFNTQSLIAMQDTLNCFHQYQEIFLSSGVCWSFNLPWQHSLKHFIQMIQVFGTPNGLCSSIAESKHIKAIKKPYQQSSHYEALGQMLLINQHLDKLVAVWVDFQKHGMLEGTCLLHTLQLMSKLSEFQYIFKFILLWLAIIQLTFQLKRHGQLQKMKW